MGANCFGRQLASRCIDANGSAVVQPDRSYEKPEREVSMMEITIRPESTKDHTAVWQVNSSAFETDAEANLADALRSGGYAMVSLVAELDEEIVGHILFSKLSIITTAGEIEAVSLAPMAVTPDHQRLGVGSQLVRAGLEACRLQGHKFIVVLGHPNFYPRFGFTAEQARPLQNPFGGGDAWMALELEPSSLNSVAGHVEYPSPFGEF
jgi:putative acetyltransferase